MSPGGSGHEGEKVYATIADMLEERGRTMARVEGWCDKWFVERYAKGYVEGYTEAYADELAHMSTSKFGPLPDGVLSRLRAASVDQLKSWFGQMMDAGSLDEVFD